MVLGPLEDAASQGFPCPIAIVPKMFGVLHDKLLTTSICTEIAPPVGVVSCPNKK